VTDSLSLETGEPSVPREERLVLAIRGARVTLGWTQADLAKASGVSEVTIARMEVGMISPRLSTFLKLRSALEKVGVEIVDNDPVDGMTIRFSAQATSESQARYRGGRILRNARVEGRGEPLPAPPTSGEPKE